MAGVWRLEEARLVQTRTANSGADANELVMSNAIVPAGKLWVVTGFGYYPSVAETQTIGIGKYINGGTGILSLLNPVSLALNPARATFIEQGMEYLLFPGEYLNVTRGAHTAGSSMIALLQHIEIDLPLYTYDEPQVVKRQTRAISSVRSMLGGGVGRGGSGGVAPIGGGGRRGGGGPAPI